MGVVGAVFAVLVIVGLGAAGMTLLRDAIAQGDSLVLPFALLAIPLLAIGLVVAAVVAAIVPSLRHGHDRARSVMAVFAAVVLGVGIYGINSDIPTQRPDAAVTRAVASACAGQPVALAGSIHTDGSVRNHLVVLDATGAEAGWTGKAALAWRPATIDDVEVVACIAEETQSRVDVCRYEGGSDSILYSATRQVRVVAAKTGLELAKFEVTDMPGSCPSVKVEGSDSKITADVAWEEVEAHLASFVENGTFVDPDAPGASLGADGSAAPATNVKEVALTTAIADGLVSAKGTGGGLESLELRVTSKVTEPLRILVSAGTYLDPGRKATQAMVVIASTTIDLEPEGTATETLDVACAQMHDDQPGNSDTFKVRAKTATGDLRRLLATDAFGAAEFRIQQFAIWTITNNPTKTGYIGIGSFGFGSGPDKTELRQIKTMFRDAGIDPTDYRALK